MRPRVRPLNKSWHLFLPGCKRVPNTSHSQTQIRLCRYQRILLLQRHRRVQRGQVQRCRTNMVRERSETSSKNCTVQLDPFLTRFLSLSSLDSTNTPGSYTCEDKNECLDPYICEYGYECENTDGSYNCNDKNECEKEEDYDCPPGYEW